MAKAKPTTPDPEVRPPAPEPTDPTPATTPEPPAADPLIQAAGEIEWLRAEAEDLAAENDKLKAENAALKAALERVSTGERIAAVTGAATAAGEALERAVGHYAVACGHLPKRTVSAADPAAAVAAYQKALGVWSLPAPAEVTPAAAPPSE